MRTVKIATLLAAVLLLIQPAAAQSQGRELMRTPDGQPDISGVFTFRTLTPMERPRALEGRETLSPEDAAAFKASERTRLNRDLFDPQEGAPSGRISYKPGFAEARRLRRLNLRNGFADHYTDRSLPDRCLMGSNAGPPMRPGSYNNSEDTHLIERFRRIDPDTVVYEFTIQDPNNFTRSWTAVIPFRRTQGPLYEYACHEGNYGLYGIMAGARRLQTQAVSPEPTVPHRADRERHLSCEGNNLCPRPHRFNDLEPTRLTSFGVCRSSPFILRALRFS